MNEVTSGTGSPVTTHTSTAPQATDSTRGVNLDKVTALIHKELVVPAAAKVEAQQANLRGLEPNAKQAEIHHVSEGFIGSVVRNAADQGLLNQIIELVVAELLKAFNKPKPATATPTPHHTP